MRHARVTGKYERGGNLILRPVWLLPTIRPLRASARHGLLPLFIDRTLFPLPFQALSASRVERLAPTEHFTAAVIDWNTTASSTGLGPAARTVELARFWMRE
jgi:hypothetical protein